MNERRTRNSRSSSKKSRIGTWNGIEIEINAATSTRLSYLVRLVGGFFSEFAGANRRGGGGQRPVRVSLSSFKFGQFARRVSIGVSSWRPARTKGVRPLRRSLRPLAAVRRANAAEWANCAGARLRTHSSLEALRGCRPPPQRREAHKRCAIIELLRHSPTSLILSMRRRRRRQSAKERKAA